jgi:adenine-specific DNA-methyltransferase
MLVKSSITGAGDPSHTKDNMVIKGDNLKVLKDLLDMGWSEKIECSIIDPSYDYDDHTKWLANLRELFVLIKQILTKGGTLWILVNDRECHYLKIVLDDIFGRTNFLADCAWQNTNPDETPSDSRVPYTTISNVYDHVLVYCKSKTRTKIRDFERTEIMNSRYTNPDNDSRGRWKSSPLSVPLMGSHGSSFHSNGGHSDFIYSLKAPSGKKILPPPGRCWRCRQEKIEDMVRDNRIIYSKNEIPRYKVFLSEVRKGKVPGTFWPGDEFGTTSEAEKEVQCLFGGEHHTFQTPRPERLLERILTMATDEGSMVLDCFAGSGTTMAVAHKMRRRYIGIDIGDQCETLCVQRLKKVIEGEQGGISTLVDWKGGGGFEFYNTNYA